MVTILCHSMTTSNAAVASLTVPSILLHSDGLLNLIVNLLPPNQVKVSVPKKGSLSLQIHDSTKTLTCRNAILRTLCSQSLHNELDKYPFCLMGGYAEATIHPSSTEAAMIICSIGSFMSVADLVRSGDKKEKDILAQLDEVLLSNSFLVGMTSKPTLADYDVFFSLCEKDLLNNEDGCLESLKNLKRWVLTILASMEELIALRSSTSNSLKKGIPSVGIPSVDFSIADPLPVFFYGEEQGENTTFSNSTPTTTVTAMTSPEQSQAELKKLNSEKGGECELTETEKKIAAEKRAKKNAEKAERKKANTAAAQKGGQVKSGVAKELDVTALDIRVGKIIEVWEHESSEKLWCEKVDLGEDKPRQILSGLRQFYKKEEMNGCNVLVLCNLKKRNLAGIPSHGMVLCATNSDHTSVEFVIPPSGVKIGERVQFEGLDGEPEPENKLAKKKMLEKLAPDLKTNSDGVVVWKGRKSLTSAGPCVASKRMKDAQVS